MDSGLGEYTDLMRKYGWIALAIMTGVLMYVFIEIFSGAK